MSGRDRGVGNVGKEGARASFLVPHSALLLALPVIVLLLWTVAFPNVAVVAGSFGKGLEHWRTFAASPADREALWTSLVVSVASVVAAVAVGLPLAFLLSRIDFPGRRVLQGVATIATSIMAVRVSRRPRHQT